jgi:hypothetical protein
VWKVNGRSKQKFRREFNEHYPKRLEKNVRQSLDSRILTMPSIWRYERKTRDYRKSYFMVENLLRDNKVKADNLSMKPYEDIRKKYKCHRTVKFSVVQSGGNGL